MGCQDLIGVAQVDDKTAWLQCNGLPHAFVEDFESWLIGCDQVIKPLSVCSTIPSVPLTQAR